ncbi:MAG: hypothetical protein LBB76_07640 [Azoarcus sp.]|jgi:hypothetical protein|nr:hypothetical protein [Azoarcus sp.]
MLRFFLFMVSVMTVGASAEDISPCTVDMVPIQIMTPGDKIQISAARISPPHFRAFVETVTEHIVSRMTKDKLCINGARDMENMRSVEREKRSMLQFVYWDLDTIREYTVPVLSPLTGGPSSSCQIYSPWIDIIVDRRDTPQIRGIVRWNDRQLLADQAILAGAKNVSPEMAMPLDRHELSYFVREIRRQSAAKPVEARVPPDILWLLRFWVGREYFADEGDPVRGSMYGVTKNGAEGYTKLVLALIDRCFVPSASGRVDINYSSILDIADPILLEQYKIKTRSLH